MSTFNTKKEAEVWARKRKAGFRKLMQTATTTKRKNFLKKSIASVKIKKVKLKHWSKPMYKVIGR